MTDQEKKARRAEIARENGRKSKGPVSIAGKYRSSRNATATGQPVDVAILAVDDNREYARLFRPDSEQEPFLVRYFTAEFSNTSAPATLKTKRCAPNSTPSCASNPIRRARSASSPGLRKGPRRPRDG
jgi:hypothetical protein